VLSGGTGTPKLLQGLKEVFDLSVIVNTAEDVWISGNKVCPDIDSVIYSLAGVIDDEKWWGVKGDTFETHEKLKELGFEEELMIGDSDRAVHILRSELLRKGYTLTEATAKLKNKFGIAEEILPMCEEDVLSIIVTPEGEMHFQEFWVKYKGQPEVIDVSFKGIENAKMTDEVKKSLKGCEAVLIGPSNPITSISPIVSTRGFREHLKKKKVIAVSPISRNKPFSGPAGKLMNAKGFEVSSKGVAEIYSDFLDTLIVDESDRELESIHDNIRFLATDTFMKSREDALKLAKFIEKIIM